ncbi:hypothetical protein [Nocardia sp. NPDC005366]|uniref:hypothetical protein n=1 Tax=Nocardia sp. NPDC005366 TaxID=3156878 RepID=UPI0033AB4DC0
MATQTKIRQAPALKPSRLNFAGWCMWCLTQGCLSSRCVKRHTRSAWEVCTDCGGTETVGAHLDRETSYEPCSCSGGLMLSKAAGAALSAVPDVKPLVVPKKNTRRSKVIGYSAEGRPLERINGKVHEVFDSNDPEQWF